MKHLAATLLLLSFSTSFAAPNTLYSVNFDQTPLGQTPAGWKDLVNYRPSRNWAVDGNGFLRVMLKEYVGNPVDGDRKSRREYLEGGGLRHFHGLLVYEGPLADGGDPRALRDVLATATFKKTTDANVSFGVVLRVKDRDNYYEARFVGADRLRVLKIKDNTETELASFVTRQRPAEGEVWTLEFSAVSEQLTARVRDAKGVEQARADALDEEFPNGAAGLKATTFAAAREFSLQSPAPFSPKPAMSKETPAVSYPVVRAVEDPEKHNTPFSKLADSYDVVVAGAGTGGFGAAVQAARLGARVLLLEESDFIGGQMANAAVTSMDDGGLWGKNPVRERGIYREFHESAANHYYTIDKDPFTAYHFNRQSEGGYEPKVARGILYGLIEETRKRNGGKTILDLAVRTKVVEVKKSGDKVTGAVIEEWTPDGPRRKTLSSKVLIDATEYGDVIPLAGARYRVGTSTSDAIDPASRVQDHTWVGVIREYPGGLPDELKMKEPPPGYETIARRFKNYQLYGDPAWGGANREKKGPRLWWVYASWRGMPDSSSAATGEMTEYRHTKCGLNGGNDYPVTAATMEDPARRARDELEGINRTLAIIYWFQHGLGLPWSVADEEGYNTVWNMRRMRDRGVRADLLPIAARLPQWPYVRESRRIIGVETLRGEDLYTRDRGDEAAKHWASTVAINDYSFDLHGTEDSLEAGLDEKDYLNATGPFPVPFGVFIPEKVDGFLPAEKNFSQSRLANGATRLQPSTILDGQAAGAIAAMAVKKNLQPRQLNIIDVQAALLAAGDTLMSRWYSDVPHGTPLWQATQLLSLYGMMDRPGPMPKEGLLGDNALWGAAETVSAEEIRAVLQQLGKIVPDKSRLSFAPAQTSMTRAEFALAASGILRNYGKYSVADAPPYAPPHNFEKARKAAQKKKTKSEAKSQ